MKYYYILRFLPVVKLGCLWQRLLSSPLKRGAGGVFWQTYTPLYPLFLEGNHIRLKFLDVKLGFVLQGKTKRHYLFLSFPHVFSGNPAVVETWMPDKHVLVETGKHSGMIDVD